MNNQFLKAMSNRSDGELIEIVSKLQDDYQPEAVEAAYKEIKKRGLSQKQVAEAKLEIERKKQKDKQKENASLESSAKILFFVFFWGVIPWLIVSTYKNKGYVRKYKEAWKYMLFGLFFFVAFSFLMIIIINFTL